MSKDFETIAKAKAEKTCEIYAEEYAAIWKQKAEVYEAALKDVAGIVQSDSSKAYMIAIKILAQKQ